MKKELKGNKQTKIYDYILLFLVCAFIGWFWEGFMIFINEFTFVNRGLYMDHGYLYMVLGDY